MNSQLGSVKTKTQTADGGASKRQLRHEPSVFSSKMVMSNSHTRASTREKMYRSPLINMDHYPNHVMKHIGTNYQKQYMFTKLKEAHKMLEGMTEAQIKTNSDFFGETCLQPATPAEPVVKIEEQAYSEQYTEYSPSIVSLVPVTQLESITEK